MSKRVKYLRLQISVARMSAACLEHSDRRPIVLCSTDINQSLLHSFATAIQLVPERLVHEGSELDT